MDSPTASAVTYKMQGELLMVQIMIFVLIIKVMTLTNLGVGRTASSITVMEISGK